MRQVLFLLLVRVRHGLGNHLSDTALVFICLTPQRDRVTVRHILLHPTTMFHPTAPPKIKMGVDPFLFVVGRKGHAATP